MKLTVKLISLLLAFTLSTTALSATRKSIINAYVGAVNGTDEIVRNEALDTLLAQDSEFYDPMSSAVGIEQVKQAINTFKTQFPGYTFTIKNIDLGLHYHVTYEWDMFNKEGKYLSSGRDVMSFNKDKKIVRILGFF